MKKTSKKSLLFLFGTIILFLSASFVIFTSFFELKSHSDTLIENKKELSEKMEKRKEIERMGDLSEIEMMAKNLKTLFVDGERPVEEILFMENLANRHRLSINMDVSRNQISSLTGDPCLLFSLTLSGSLEDLLNFMEGVETKSRVAAVKDWEIIFTGNEGQEMEEVSVRADLQIEVFTLKADE